jgi:hypothetical protein
MKKILIVTNDTEDFIVMTVKPKNVGDKLKGLSFAEILIDENIDLNQEQINSLKSIRRNKNQHMTNIFVYNELRQ